MGTIAAVERPLTDVGSFADEECYNSMVWLIEYEVKWRSVDATVMHCSAARRRIRLGNTSSLGLDAGASGNI